MEGRIPRRTNDERNKFLRTLRRANFSKSRILQDMWQTGCVDCTACSSPAPSRASVRPPVAAPRPTNRGLIVGLAIVGVPVVLGCLAIGVFGFWFTQSKPTVSSQLPVGTPQVAIAPLSVVPTNGARSTPASPTQPPSVATRVQPTSAPLLTAAPKPSPIPVTVPCACWFTADDFKSLAGMPTDFEQSEGSGDWWDFEGGNITWYGSYTTFSRQSGYIYVSCWHYANQLAKLDMQVPTGYTCVDLPVIGDKSYAYQRQNYQRVRFAKGNSLVSVSFSDTAPYVITENAVKLANIIAGRMPSTVSMKQLPHFPEWSTRGVLPNTLENSNLGAQTTILNSFQLQLLLAMTLCGYR